MSEPIKLEKRTPLGIIKYRIEKMLEAKRVERMQIVYPHINDSFDAKVREIEGWIDCLVWLEACAKEIDE